MEMEEGIKKSITKKKFRATRVLIRRIHTEPKLFLFWVGGMLGGIGVLFLFIFFPVRIPVASHALPPLQTVFDAPVVDVEEIHTSRRLSNGAWVPADDTGPLMVGMMIDAAEEAYPQAALSEARIVYEAPVEGPFTRFLALYDVSQDIAKVGPIRSARPYYLDWMSEYGMPLYLHVGGSPEALSLLPRYSLVDINEYYRGWLFWRDDVLPRPHNVFTSSTLMREMADAYAQATTSIFSAWAFKEDASYEARGTISGITVPYSSQVWEPSWVYDRVENEYYRFNDGELTRDAGAKAIKAKNVIIQYATVRILDEVGRRRITTIGSGKALVFRDGQAIEGIWKKESRTGRTLWFDLGGNPIPLNAGTTWIEVFPNTKEVQYE